MFYSYDELPEGKPMNYHGSRMGYEWNMMYAMSTRWKPTMFEIYVKVPDVEAKVGGLFAMVSSLAREWRYNAIQ